MKLKQPRINRDGMLIVMEFMRSKMLTFEYLVFDIMCLMVYQQTMMRGAGPQALTEVCKELREMSLSQVPHQLDGVSTTELDMVRNSLQKFYDDLALRLRDEREGLLGLAAHDAG
jgi:hypothetical protein